MTQYIYIASPLKLATGTFGSKSISSDKPAFFESELDYTHLYFENNYHEDQKSRFSYSPHFSFKHQVTANANHLPLAYELRKKRHKSLIPLEDKCLALLYEYLDKAIQTSRILEYFTSNNGEEHLPISKKRSVEWSDIKDPYDLVLEDLEFWEITKY